MEGSLWKSFVTCPAGPAPEAPSEGACSCFASLPTLLLGVTYFLFVEFALRELLNLYDVPPLLRYGGAALAVLFSLVALGVGSMLADGFLRPLRALLRVAEAQDSSPGPTAYLSDPDPYLRRLFLRVFTLVQQNRSGAQTLKDLESLRGEILTLRERIRFAATVSSLPTPRAAGRRVDRRSRRRDGSLLGATPHRPRGNR